ncbi:hypothetical protein ACJ72_07791, partial [Emergomyces africanus]
MKSNTILLALPTLLTFLIQVHGQADFQMPECALPCQDAVGQVTHCRTDDYKCICSEHNFEKIQKAATPCVLKNCKTFAEL